MKKIVSEPRLIHQNSGDSWHSTDADSYNYSHTHIGFSDPSVPVKLGDYLKTRNDTKKTAIFERIKSNSTLLIDEDLQSRSIRERQESIIKRTDKLVNLLLKRKMDLIGKSLEQLERED